MEIITGKKNNSKTMVYFLTDSAIHTTTLVCDTDVSSIHQERLSFVHAVLMM